LVDAHKNFAYSLVATAPSPASSGTSLVVTAADGAKFPAVPFNATIWPAGAQPTTANAEIVRVTLISTDTFTITRAQESSSARTVVIGDQIAATITAKTLTDVEHDQFANTYLTVADETIPASSQVIYEDYLELAASFEYELAADAILVIGDFATPLPAPDQNPNIFIAVNDETIPKNSEVVYSDYYELTNPFGVEVGVGGLIQVGTGMAALPSLVLWDSGYLAADGPIDSGANAIPPGHFGLVLCGYLRSASANTNDNFTLVVNGDSTIATPGNRIQEASTSVAGAVSTSALGVMGTVLGNNAASQYFGSFYGTIIGYDSTNFKSLHAWTDADDTTGSNQIQTLINISYATAAAINRVAVVSTASGGAYKAGSRLVIYGMQ
jgi:hypothetical protein